MNVSGYKQGMKDAKDSTQQYNTETKKIKDNLQSFRGEMGRAKKEVQNLALAYSQLSKEAKQSQFGQEMKKQLDAAKQSAAELIDLQGDLSTELKNLASDTPVLDTLSDSMGIFMNVTSTAMGALAQFTGNEKDAQRAVVAFTTAQSALNTLTGIANALQSQSTLMLGIRKVQELATTAAIALRTAAESKGIVVTKAATVAQAAFNAVANANPYVLLATAIVTVIGAVASYIAITSEEEEEQERANKKIQEHIDKLKKQADAYVSAAGESIIMARDIENLREEYKNCNDEISKTAILEEAAEKFKKLGMEVKGTSQAEDILINQGDKVIELIRLQGEMAAVTALKIETLKNTIKGLMELGFDSDQANNIAKYNTQFQQLEKTENRLRKESAKLKKELNIKSDVFGSKSGGSKSGKQDIEIKIEKGSLAEAEKKLKELEEKRTKINIDSPDLPKIKKEIEDLKKDIAAKKIILGIEIDKSQTKTEILSEIEKKMQDELNEAKSALILAITTGDAKNIDELILKYDKLKESYEQYEQMKKNATEGVTVTGSKELGPAMSGDFDKSINGYNTAISALQNKMQSIDLSSGLDGAKEQWDQLAGLISQYREQLTELRELEEEATQTTADREAKKVDKLAKNYMKVSDAVGTVGDSFKSLSQIAENDPVLDVAGIIAEAIANVFAGFAQATAQAGSMGPWAWIAFALAGLATTLGMVAQIKSAAEAHAMGGIVGGSSYSGDNILTRLNSGEMVLNKRQQQNLFNAIDSGNISSNSGPQTVQVQGVIHGTDILLVSKQTNKLRARTGTEIKF